MIRYEYVIYSKRNDDCTFIEEISGKNFLKIIDSIVIDENRNYMFFINNYNSNYISIVLYSLSGNAV
jgi:hypothetical protein